jgi:HSP20 family protein
MLPVPCDDPVSAPIASGTIDRWNSLFKSTLGEEDLLGPRGRGVPLAMWEDDDHVYVEAELPGLRDQDVGVTIHNGRLFIRGERKPEGDRRGVRDGRIYGRFERVITLPIAVDAERARAELTHGVLSLTLTKSPKAKPKRIALQSRGSRPCRAWGRLAKLMAALMTMGLVLLMAGHSAL